MFLLPGPAVQTDHERIVCGETIDDALHVAEIGERVHALRTSFDLAHRLGAAEEQHGEHGLRPGVEIEHVVGDVAVLRHPVRRAVHDDA